MESDQSKIKIDERWFLNNIGNFLLKFNTISLGYYNSFDLLDKITCLKVVNEKNQIIPSSIDLTVARVLNPENNVLWENSYLVNNEILNFTLKRKTNNIKAGKYIALVINGRTISYDLDYLIKNNGKSQKKPDSYVSRVYFQLKNNFIKEFINETIVYSNVGDGIKQVKAPIFTPETYSEAQKDPDFLKKYPVFVGLFSETDVININKGLAMLDEFYDVDFNNYPTLKNIYEGFVPGHMVSGTKNLWDKIDEFHNKLMPERRINFVFPPFVENYGFLMEMGNIYDASIIFYDDHDFLDKSTIIGINKQDLENFKKFYNRLNLNDKGYELIDNSFTDLNSSLDDIW